MAEKPYKVIIEGQNGAGSQVFEAETPEELRDQFQQAQTNATAKIREQAEALRAREEEIASYRQSTNGNGNGNGNGDDAITKAWVQGVETVVQSKFNMPLDEFAQQFRHLVNVTNQQEVSIMGTKLLAEMPHIGGSSDEEWHKNGEKIGKYIQENGLPMTYANLRAAAIVLEKDGKLKVSASNPDSEVTLTPVPTTVSRPAAAVNVSESREHFLRTAPTEEVRTFLEKEWAAKQRA